eukprot:3480613-Pleurochrysis_carterae.AAC.1
MAATRCSLAVYIAANKRSSMPLKACATTAAVNNHARRHRRPYVPIAAPEPRRDRCPFSFVP